ncbi:hypothetical protein MMC07_001251 [Pseudocyphellaria aurata]|nr:hypothetical protein [Pseudocyphellaria aurata]
MFLPTLVFTAYLALHSQKKSIGNEDSSADSKACPYCQASDVVSEIGRHVVEVNGQPNTNEAIDVKFDDFNSGIENPYDKHHGATLKYGGIYEVSDFPNVPNEFDIKKIWGVFTNKSYSRLDLLFDSEIPPFVYNIG